MAVESQEAMGTIVHSQRVLIIVGDSLVVFVFGTIGLTHVNDFLNKAHRFPFLTPVLFLILFFFVENMSALESIADAAIAVGFVCNA